ncbi:hypothetical protein GCM10025868_19340 [Angustibacter aerolatus]|uniref:Uncharacterized protein n=1 Tax=Angustibacter aerolatus TaxID=1162965 RepID=A0ABQ6JFV8_9ACTN|nr:hypothetical protein GCM10025868_19340 [Angustibacter aerolatus]
MTSSRLSGQVETLVQQPLQRAEARLGLEPAGEGADAVAGVAGQVGERERFVESLRGPLPGAGERGAGLGGSGARMNWACPRGARARRRPAGPPGWPPLLRGRTG